MRALQEARLDSCKTKTEKPKKDNVILENAVDTNVDGVLLVVVVEGETVSDNGMMFKSVYRCQEFASAIEQGKWSE